MEVIWWEIGAAAVLALVALPLWRVGMRRLMKAHWPHPCKARRPGLVMA
jgi:hypothetical protein